MSYTYTPSTTTKFELNGLDMDSVAAAAATSYKVFGFTQLDSKWDSLDKVIGHLEDRVVAAKENDELIDVTIINGEYLPAAAVEAFKNVAAKYKKNIKFTVSLLPDVDAKKPITVTY